MEDVKVIKEVKLWCSNTGNDGGNTGRGKKTSNKEIKKVDK